MLDCSLISLRQYKCDVHVHANRECLFDPPSPFRVGSVEDKDLTSEIKRRKSVVNLISGNKAAHIQRNIANSHL